MNPMIFTVVANIKANPKRMAKLNAMCCRDRRMQARKYVIAECQAIHFKANEDEIIQMAVRISG